MYSAYLSRVTNTRMQAHTHECTRARPHRLTNKHTHACTHTNALAPVHMHTHVCTHARTCPYMYTHAHTHTHIHTHNTKCTVKANKQKCNISSLSFNNNEHQRRPYHNPFWKWENISYRVHNGYLIYNATSYRIVNIIGHPHTYIYIHTRLHHVVHQLDMQAWRYHIQ